MDVSITVSSAAVINAFNSAIAAVGHLDPLMRVIGENNTERVKRRFETQTAPDGKPWKSNSQATIENYISKKGGYGSSGKITQRGSAYAMSKRPLHGLTEDLSRQITYRSDSDSVTFVANPVYAAIQHFGASKSQYAHLWGDIPARPYMPVNSIGQLYSEEVDEILRLVQAYILSAFEK